MKQIKFVVFMKNMRAFNFMGQQLQLNKLLNSKHVTMELSFGSVL